jgi:MFS family permease
MNLRRGLLRHDSYSKLWAGKTISGLGDQITVLALPLLAVTVLDAGSGQMGILRAAETGPILLIGLFAGVWVDRIRRRPVLIATDLARAALLLSIPIAAWLDLLRIELLYIVAIAVGTLNVFFEVARQSYITSIVERADLVEANGTMMVSESASEVAGPAIAGGLIQLIGGSATILVDAISFLVSALFVLRIRTKEAIAPKPTVRPHVWREMKEGLLFVARNPILRTLAGGIACWNVFENARNAILVLYASRELGLSAGAIGLLFAIGSVGFFLGALLPAWLSRRFGLGKTLVGSLFVLLIGDLLFGAIAIAPRSFSVSLLIGGLFVYGFGIGPFDVNQFSLRQAVTPDRLLGRVNASMRVLIRGAVPIGALLGGVIGGIYSLETVLFLSAFGTPVMMIWLFRSEIPKLHRPPESQDEELLVIEPR